MKRRFRLFFFFRDTSKYDALIVRINPGQLSQGTPDGTQKRFDDLMNKYIAQGINSRRALHYEWHQRAAHRRPPLAFYSHVRCLPLR